MCSNNENRIIFSINLFFRLCFGRVLNNCHSAIHCAFVYISVRSEFFHGYCLLWREHRCLGVVYRRPFLHILVEESSWVSLLTLHFTTKRNIAWRKASLFVINHLTCWFCTKRSLLRWQFAVFNVLFTCMFTASLFIYIQATVYRRSALEHVTLLLRRIFAHIRGFMGSLLFIIILRRNVNIGFLTCHSIFMQY